MRTALAYYVLLPAFESIVFRAVVQPDPQHLPGARNVVEVLPRGTCRAVGTPTTNWSPRPSATATSRLQAVVQLVQRQASV